MSNWRGLRVSERQDTLVLPLSDLKLYLRVAHDDEDGLIEDLVRAATRFVERETGLALVPTVFVLTLDGFPPQIDLPSGPVAAISDVRYRPSVGADWAALDASAYRLELGQTPARVLPVASWPSVVPHAGAVEVSFWCASGGVATTTVPSGDNWSFGGVSPASTVSEELILAVRQLVAHWYLNREAAGASMALQPLGVQAILDGHRAHGWVA